MTKRIAHIITGAWLAVLLLFGTTPMEFVHAFAHHTDTVHRQAKKGQIFIEQEHHHCSFLSFTLNIFHNDAASFRPVIIKKSTHLHYATLVRHLLLRSTPARTSRGPPAVA